MQEVFEFLKSWLKSSEDQIFNTFLKCEGAKIYGRGIFQNLYVPGKRKDGDRVLLVAHRDTVWLDTPRIEPVLSDDGIIFSKKMVRGLDKDKHPVAGGIGIGADDRAGIAALWKLKELGHSILITSCEEQGCLGAIGAICNDELYSLIQGHNFAIELDRKGKRDLVFYNVGGEKFEDYCIKETGYRFEEGTSSDISILCDKICGVNISIGYKNEHTAFEVLNIKWWQNTVDVVTKWLSQENLPSFTH